jgi:hypothetical protein
MNESEQRRIAELGKYLEQNYDPSEIWDGRVAARVLREQYADWLLDFAPWMVFGTLTFREDKFPDVAKSYFFRLVDTLNRDLFGKKYKRYVSHSYFSYVLVLEYQIREVVHFHFLADKPLNFQLLHDHWNEHAGFAFTDIIKDREKAVRYLSKYIVKCGEPEQWKASCDRMPLVIPTWWDSNDVDEIREFEPGQRTAPGDAPA